jgi:uncharacterized protein (DUF1810 family)
MRDDGLSMTLYSQVEKKLLALHTGLEHYIGERQDRERLQLLAAELEATATFIWGVIR